MGAMSLCMARHNKKRRREGQGPWAHVEGENITDGNEGGKIKAGLFQAKFIKAIEVRPLLSASPQRYICNFLQSFHLTLPPSSADVRILPLVGIGNGRSLVRFHEHAVSVSNNLTSAPLAVDITGC